MLGGVVEQRRDMSELPRGALTMGMSVRTLPPHSEGETVWVQQGDFSQEGGSAQPPPIL